MFEIQEDKQTNPTDLLLDLNSPENIELKTQTTTEGIRVEVELEYWKHIKNGEHFIVALQKAMLLQKKLMVSYKRQSRSESIKGISEMREQFQEQEKIIAKNT